MRAVRFAYFFRAPRRGISASYFSSESTSFLPRRCDFLACPTRSNEIRMQSFFDKNGIAGGLKIVMTGFAVRPVRPFRMHYVYTL